MKTPRELLLDRHQAMNQPLDKIRKQVLRSEGRALLEHSRRREEAEKDFGLLKSPPRHLGGYEVSGPGDWLAVLWSELVRPYRRLWTGLAAAWVVILALHVSTRERPPATQARIQERPPESRLLLREQRLLRTELLGAYSDADAAPVPWTPTPRSERMPRIPANHHTAQVGGAGTKVAQVSNLPYRGFLIRSPLAGRTACRLEVGDTADWKSALQAQRCPPSRNLRKNSVFLSIVI